MPVVTSSLVAPSVLKMLASCPASWSPNNNTKSLFQAFATAYAAYLESWLRSIKIVGGTVSGGLASAGGPLSGGILLAIPGSASAIGYRKIVDVFVPPVFSITMPDGTQRTGSFTPWLRSAVATVSAEIDTKMQMWLKGWTTPSLPVAVGGSAAWVTSTPPAAGPWTGGTITPFLFSGAAGGVSLNQALITNISRTLELKARGTTVNIVTDMKGGTSPTQLVNDFGDSAALFNAFSSGFTTMLASALTTVLVRDAIGGSGFGVAAPVTGSIMPGNGFMGMLTLDV